MKKYQILLTAALFILIVLTGCTIPEDTASTITVTISVDCKTAVDYGNELAASISDDGVILGGKEVTLEKGATIYDALEHCGLVIGAHSTSWGQYVYSIQSLQEKACGGESGWLYFVNEETVNESCSSYTLEDGDSVQWRYSCNYGEDL